MKPFSEAISEVKGQSDSPGPPLKLRSLLWRSGLLNLAIIVTALPVMVFAGGPEAAVPALTVMGALSLVIWLATLAAFGFISIVRAILRFAAWVSRHWYQRLNGDRRLADEWLDGPG